MTSKNDANGIVTAYTYDNRGNMTRMVEAASGFGYVAGDPINHRDKDGRLLNFIVGAAVGAVAASTDPMRASVARRRRTIDEI